MDQFYKTEMGFKNKGQEYTENAINRQLINERLYSRSMERRGKVDEKRREAREEKLKQVEKKFSHMYKNGKLTKD